VNVTITANETKVTENETLNITIESNATNENTTEIVAIGNGTVINFDIKDFLIENRAYIIGAIIIVFLVVLFSTGLWRKIIDFFEEDEIVEKKK
jgi:hypothetical protein